MRVLKVYKAVVAKDCSYQSGRGFLVQGQDCEVHVSETGETIWVLDPYLGINAPFVYSTNDENWVWEHLFLELPWKSEFKTMEEQKNYEQAEQEVTCGAGQHLPIDGDGEKAPF